MTKKKLPYIVAGASLTVAAVAGLVVYRKCTRARRPAALPGNPATWTVSEVRHWLATAGSCQRTCDTFERQAIDGSVLVVMTSSHFAELGVAFGDRVRLEAAMSQLRLRVPREAPPPRESSPYDDVMEALQAIQALHLSHSFTASTGEERDAILEQSQQTLRDLSSRIDELPDGAERADARQLLNAILEHVSKLGSPSRSLTGPTTQLMAMLQTFDDLVQSEDFRNAPLAQQRALREQVMQQLAKVRELASHMPAWERDVILPKCDNVARHCATEGGSPGREAPPHPIDLSTQLRGLIDDIGNTDFSAMSAAQLRETLSAFASTVDNIRERAAGLSERERGVVENVLKQVESVLQGPVREPLPSAPASGSGALSADDVVARIRALLSSLSDASVAQMDGDSRVAFIRGRQQEAATIRQGLSALTQEEREVLEGVVGKVEQQLAQLLRISSAHPPPRAEASDDDGTVIETLQSIEGLLRSPAFQNADVSKQRQVAVTVRRRLEGTMEGLAALAPEAAARAHSIQSAILQQLAAIPTGAAPPAGDAPLSASDVVGELKEIYATLQDPELLRSPDRKATITALMARLQSLRDGCSHLSPDNQEVLLPHIDELNAALGRLSQTEADGDADEEGDEEELPPAVQSVVETVHRMRQQIRRALPDVSSAQAAALLEAVNRLIEGADAQEIPWRSFNASRNEMQLLIREMQDAMEGSAASDESSPIESTIRDAIALIKQRPPTNPADLEPFMGLLSKCADAIGALSERDLEPLYELHGLVKAAQERMAAPQQGGVEYIASLTTQLRHASRPTLQLRALHEARRVVESLSATESSEAQSAVDGLTSAMRSAVSIPRTEFVTGATQAEVQLLLSRIVERIGQSDFVGDTTFFELVVIDRLVARLASSPVVRGDPSLTSVVVQVSNALRHNLAPSTAVKDPQEVTPELSVACLRSETSDGCALVQYTLHTAEEDYTPDPEALAHLSGPGSALPRVTEPGGLAIVVTTTDTGRLAELSMLSDLLIDRCGFTVVDFVATTQDAIKDFLRTVSEAGELPPRIVFVALTTPLGADAPLASLERQDGLFFADGFVKYADIVQWGPRKVPTAVLHDSGTSLRTLVGCDGHISTLLGVALSSAAACIVNASRSWLFDNIFAVLMGELLVLHTHESVAAESIVHYCVGQLGHIDTDLHSRIGDTILATPLFVLGTDPASDTE